MANQQLLDYIAQQLQQGLGRDQVKASLLAVGWQEQDVEDGFSGIASPVPMEQPQVVPGGAPRKIQKIIFGVLLVILFVGGIYFAISKKTATSSNKVASQSPTIKPTATATASELSQAQAAAIAFPDKLSTCTKFKTTFIHPLTGGTMNREVLGIVNGKCGYTEQMPNNGRMDCSYTESERKVIAQYYKDILYAQSVGTSTHIDLGSDGSSQHTATYTIDGKVVDNPLANALDSGDCVISGY